MDAAPDLLGDLVRGQASSGGGSQKVDVDHGHRSGGVLCPTIRGGLLLLDFAENGRLAQREQNNLFPGCRADVVVQTDDLHAGD